MTLREQIRQAIQDAWTSKPENPWGEFKDDAADAILSLLRERIEALPIISLTTSEKPTTGHLDPGRDVSFERGQNAMRNAVLKELEG